MNATRLPVRLLADSRRVIARLFVPGGPARIRAIIARVTALPDPQVASMLSALVADYRPRHKDIEGIFRRHYAAALALAGESPDASEERRLLLGAYFTNEYSLESVALFNPSMVEHPVQDGVPAGQVRFVVSLRACGEGHISSIEFRTGLVDAEHGVTVDPPTRFALTARPVDDALYDKESYVLKLREMKSHVPLAEPILALLPGHFTTSDLKGAIDRCRPKLNVTQYQELVADMLWLAHSNYELEFSLDTALSERVIFPVSESESRGIEDARFVRFTYPDGRVAYFATYTAYNGFRVLPQLIETTDFRHFKINTLNGHCVQNKGMALFPRMVGGRFLMASRLDGENIFLLHSDNIHFWRESKLIYAPKRAWEFVQVGNCGSPIETDEGWLLLTHGVGPMRQYWMGALLLDLEDPSRVIGELAEPLLVPNEDERDGYVPNVVYSCGALRHGDALIVPYAVSDSHTSVATVSIPELLAALRGGASRRSSPSDDPAPQDDPQ
ncbi:MAG TPA: glycoside hydrolase family 130 protein [Polyangiaceae bacterium]|nr:glycoside hydrolase family 130 protein [Polyangiaceae bacterium]